VLFVVELVIFAISVFVFVGELLFLLQICKHNIHAKILGPQYLTLRQLDSMNAID